MKIKDFGVEIWMNVYENNCQYNLAETCVESLTVEELLDLSGSKEEIIDEILGMQLNYGDIEGSVRLRRGIAELYKNIDIENIYQHRHTSFKMREKGSDQKIVVLIFRIYLNLKL